MSCDMCKLYHVTRESTLRDKSMSIWCRLSRVSLALLRLLAAGGQIEGHTTDFCIKLLKLTCDLQLTPLTLRMICFEITDQPHR